MDVVWRQSGEVHQEESVEGWVECLMMENGKIRSDLFFPKSPLFREACFPRWPRQFPLVLLAKAMVYVAGGVGDGMLNKLRLKHTP